MRSLALDRLAGDFIELGYPVRLLRYGVVPDSGGPGRYRGGCGIVREYEILAEEAVLAVRIDSVKNPPWGIDGGMGGGVGRSTVNPGTGRERVLAPSSDGNRLVRRDILRMETVGGSLPDYVFTKILGQPSFVIPYANADEANHAPNENLKVACFIDGIKAGAALLAELGMLKR